MNSAHVCPLSPPHTSPLLPFSFFPSRYSPNSRDVHTLHPVHCNVHWAYTSVVQHVWYVWKPKFRMTIKGCYRVSSVYAERQLLLFFCHVPEKWRYVTHPPLQKVGVCTPHITPRAPYPVKVMPMRGPITTSFRMWRNWDAEGVEREDTWEGVSPHHPTRRLGSVVSFSTMDLFLRSGYVYT